MELEELIAGVAELLGIEVEEMSEEARDEFAMRVILTVESLRRKGLIKGPEIELNLGAIKKRFPKLAEDVEILENIEKLEKT